MKKTLAMLICIMMIAGLATACSNGGTEPTSSPTASTAPTGTAAPDASAELSLPYPVMGELTTFTAWAPIASQLVGVMTGYNDVTSYQEMERLTNIHWEWQHPAAGNESEHLSMLIASQDYPDMINYFSYYYLRGLEAAIQDEIALPLNDIVDQYMPTYKAILDGNEIIGKNAKTDTGTIAALYCLYDQPQSPWYGLIVRKDWLDDCNLQEPETYDDWHTMLTAFKDQKGAVAPLMLFSKGDTPDGHMAGGYGVYSNFVNQDGLVKYGPMEAGYKEYLQMMTQWYTEGLIDRDFNTRSDPFFIPDSTFILTGKSGAFAAGGPNAYGDSAVTNKAATDPKYYTVGVSNPVKNAGEVSHFTVVSNPMGVGNIITTECSDVATVAKWLDFQYTDEGALINNYGVEGKTYTMVDGKPVLSKELMEATFGNSIDKINQMKGPVEAPFLRYMGTTVKNDWTDYESAAYKESIRAGVETWPIETYWTISSYASPTADEVAERSAIMADVETFVAEKTVRYILGVDSFDTYETDFVGQIQSMGVDRAIEITQGFVTRYENR